MGIIIRQHKRTGKFKLISSISDEKLHEEEWVDLDGAKKALIEAAFWRFIDEVNKIELDFPDAWHVNDERPKNFGGKFNKWWLENCNNPQVFLDMFNEVISRTGADIDTKNLNKENPEK